MPIKIRVAISVAVIVGAFWLGFSYNGYRLGEKMADAENAWLKAREEATRLRQQRSDAITAAIVAELDAEATRSKVITKEVIIYAQNPDNHHCDLAPDWVLHHDRAITGAAGGADAAGEGVKDADAIVTITENYNTCREELKRLEGWQRWYQETFVDAD